MLILHWFSIITAAIETLLFVGILLGWPSLQFVLEREGYFNYLCESDAETFTNVSSNSTSNEFSNTCEESQASFNLVFTLAIFAAFASSLPLGYLFDRLGTWKYRIIVGTMYTVGVALTTFSTPATSFLLYPATTILASAAIGIFFSNLQVANLTKSYRGLTISLLNGLISTSAVVFLLVKKGYDLGINLRFMLMILLCATAIIWIRTFVLMPSKLIPFPPPSPDFEYGYKEWICFKTRSVAGHFVPVSLFVVGASQPVADQVIECTNNKTMNSQDEISFKTCLKNKLF